MKLIVNNIVVCIEILGNDKIVKYCEFFIEGCVKEKLWNVEFFYIKI